VKIITILGAIAVAILLFFAIIFAFATDYWPTGLIVSAMLFLVSFGLIYFITRKPTTIIQKLETSGQMQAVPIKCPNCSASVDAKSIKIVSGVPYATCPYCGHTFQVAEEPKW
jgi:DNA-directed RNA polymerase subunit RPC12/RpoP